MMRSLDPSLPQGEMEAALEAIFGGLPGYGGVYKESVMRNGDWIDLIGGYGGPNAAWQVLNKSAAAQGAPQGGGGGGVSLPAVPTGTPDENDVLAQIMAELNRLQAGGPTRYLNDEIEQQFGA